MQQARGVTLKASPVEGISLAVVEDAEARFDLSWDRFMRLKTVADHMRRLIGSREGVRVLDVGGFDGAFAMFAPAHAIDVLDPATTGGSALRLPLADRSYEYVVSIDAIEHVPPQEREQFLSETARVATHACLVNFPNKATMPAQELVLEITGNPYVKEHVDWGLPERAWVIECLKNLGFTCQTIPNTSLALWSAQFCLAHFKPAEAQRVSRYLNSAHAEEPFTVPLYYLVIGTREG